MSKSARKSPETDKKETPLKHNRRKLEEQTMPKSINYTAAKYPSPPGVEGAQVRPRVLPRVLPRAALPKKCSNWPAVTTCGFKSIILQARSKEPIDKES